MSALTTNVREVIRLDAWRSVFEKTNRILSGESVTVTICENPPNGMEDVPGWTNGLNINLNAAKVKEMLAANDPVQAVLRLKGLNYHELSHVLYTPRMTDDFPLRVVKRAEAEGDTIWWYAFNALEDQRIETWFSATYGASKRYFEATVLEWIITNGAAEAAVLIYGRKYLEPKIRVQAGAVFAKKYDKGFYAEFQQVIDEYITLVLPADTNKAWSLLLRYVELLRKMQSDKGAPLPTLIMQDNGAAHGNMQGKDDLCRTGKVPVAVMKRAAQKADDMKQDAQDADAAAEAGGAGQAGGQSGSDAGQGSAGGGGAGADSGEDGGQDNAGGQGDQGGQSGGGAGLHKGSGKPTTLADEMDDLVQAAHNGMDDVRADEQIQDDVDNALDAVKAAVENGRMNAAGMAARAANFSADDKANLAVRKVHNTLLRIRQDAEPETLRRQVNGRVDARRILTRQPHEVDLFKAYDSGNEEETGVEAVVLIDVSGSMRSKARDASTAAWACKRAFDKLDIATTVLQFDTDYAVVYQPREKAHAGQIPLMADGGGTMPLGALTQAHRILTKSQAPNKVLLTLTDGQWSGGDDPYKPIMRQISRLGTTSMILGLDHAVSQHGRKFHTEGHDLSDVSDLPKAAVKLVSRIMAARLV